MSGGGVGADFFAFLVGTFAGGYPFGVEVVGMVIFRWQKIKLVRSWWGKYRNGGKISFRGNGREFRRKGPSQLTLCAGSDHSFSDQAYIFLLLRIFESRD